MHDGRRRKPFAARRDALDIESFRKPKLGVSFVNKEGWLAADGRTWWAVFGGINEYDGFNVVRATLTIAAGP